MFFWNFWRRCEVFWYYLNKELVIVERQGSQVYTIFSLSIPSMDFRCFHHLVLVKSAAVNMRVEVSLQDHDFRCFWGSYSSSVFNFWGTTICFSQQLHHSALKKKKAMCYNMDEPWKHHAKWNKPDTAGQLLHNHTSVMYEGGTEVTQSRPTLCDPPTVAHQAPPSMGFSRQEY